MSIKQSQLRKRSTRKKQKVESYSPKNVVARTSLAMFLTIAAVIGAFIFIPMFLLLLIPFFMSDLSEPPVILFNGAIISLCMFIVYHLIAKKRLERKRRTIMIITFISSLVFTLALSFITIPTYRSIQVATVPENMKWYLKDNYGEDFVVKDAKYSTAKILGDPWGVSAKAYPASNPSYIFSIYEGHGKVLKEDYLEKYGRLIDDNITAKLTKDLRRDAVTNRLKVDIVSYGVKDRTILLSIKEDLSVAKWKEYEKILNQSIKILNEHPYNTFTYYFGIEKKSDYISDYIHENSFACDFSPEQRIGAAYEQRLNYCVTDHNTFGKNKDPAFNVIER